MTAMLYDHFRPPLSSRRHWHAFHNAWATYLASDLNARLPEGYFAEPNVQFGIEIDVATFEEPWHASSSIHDHAVATAAWSPPAAAQTIPFAMPTDVVEVLIYDSGEGPVLAGAIELISPANKDRPEHREAFVSKCQTYLHSGAGLVMVDVVTDRKANLHDDLLARLNSPAAGTNAELYAAAYRPVKRDGQVFLDVWQQSLSVGGELPTMPLWLRGGLCLPVALGETYERTCREQRLQVSGNGGG